MELGGLGLLLLASREISKLLLGYGRDKWVKIQWDTAYLRIVDEYCGISVNIVGFGKYCV